MVTGRLSIPSHFHQSTEAPIAATRADDSRKLQGCQRTTRATPPDSVRNYPWDITITSTGSLIHPEAICALSWTPGGVYERRRISRPAGSTAHRVLSKRNHAQTGRARPHQRRSLCTSILWQPMRPKGAPQPATLLTPRRSWRHRSHQAANS